MKAIAYSPDKRVLRVVERPEPAITATDQVKIMVMRVGVCGTDRERIAEGKAPPPEGYDDLVIGHESFGRVVETGEGVDAVSPGDYAVFTIRRGCDECAPCRMGRPDMCRTGKYRERGLVEIDGFNSEYVVDSQGHVIRVPRELASVAVLLEPMSVVEKALDEAVKFQSARLPEANIGNDWFRGKRALVAGTGTIGLLACLALKVRGASVYGLDILDEDSPRPMWLSGIKASYIDGRKVKPDKVDEALGPMDLVFESAGVPGLMFNLIDALARNAVYAVAGIPSGAVHEGTIRIPATRLMDQLVRKNQLVFGTVSSAEGHFRMALDDFARAEYEWRGHAAKMINRELDFTEYKEALTEHPEDEIKAVLKWAA